MRILLLLIFISGCSAPIYPKHIRAIEEFCADKGGWARILGVSFPGAVAGMCADGTPVSVVEFER